MSKYDWQSLDFVDAVEGNIDFESLTKAELIEAYGVLKEQFDNQAADHCIAGTKLDRALVDLKEAKAKIKELTK